MDAAAERHPDVPYEPQLIDATFALLISSSGAPMVIPALNRDGDILSDLVLPLFGSIAGSESLLVAFGDDGVDRPTALMAEAAHGTAPALEGKDVANPMAMILAAAALLAHTDDEDCQQAGRAIREATLEAVAEGIRTADLGGHHGTTAFTDEVDPPHADEARGLGGAVGSRAATRRRRPGRRRSRRRRARPRNPSTISGSNCVPAQRSISAAASSAASAGRYGRPEVIASNASATARIRPSSGIVGPGASRRVAEPVPALVVEEHVRAARGWSERHAGDQPHALDRVRADLGELAVVERARASSGPPPGRSTLPTSWSAAPSLSASSCSSSQPSRTRDRLRVRADPRGVRAEVGVADVHGGRVGGESDHGTYWFPARRAEPFP